MTLGRFLLSIAFLAMAVGGASAAPPAGAHLSTFEKSTGETYFALSLSPTVKPAAAKSHDLVVLFDTSASQTGVFRDDSLTALKSMLSVLGTEDRVHLVAVDLNAVPMTPGFVGANSAEMQAALNKLDARVPLGSTDMSAALQAAVESYGAKASAGRAVVYIGDGISRANFVESREFDALAKKLVAARAPVSSFAIGPRRNIEGLAALANHTGGMLYLDSNQANSARQAGVVLAGVAKAPVVWPTAVRLPESLGEVYPKLVPPLRTDRDTVLFGVLSDAKAGSVAMTAEAAGHSVEMTWQVTPGTSNVEYNFLPQLVELARKGSGTGLPTLGTDGLREAARVIRSNADQLAELGANSLRTGDTAGAAKVADQALRLDPLNAKAQLVQGAAQRVAEDEKDLRLTQLQVPGAPASEFAERGDDFLSSVEASRRRLEGRIEAEVNLQIRQAREMMATDPSAAVRDLKLELESVNQAVGISAGVRDELSKRLAGAIREVELRENVIRQEREEAEQNRVAAEANQRLLDQLARKQALIESLMAQFDSLMDEGEYRLADTDIAAQVRELAPAQTTPIAASWMARFSSNVRDMQVLREMRHRNFAEALKRNEEALIPFTEEYPIIYPDPEEWERITNLRKKYKSMDLMGDKPQERKIYEALDKPARLEFLDTPLADVVQFLADEHKIPIHIDTLSLQDDGIDTQTPVTVNLNGVSMRAGLRLMLEGLGLTYIIDDEVLQITTPTKAETKLITKVYPVGDLVVPIAPMGAGMMGGMGGGMGQGMMGGGMGMGGMGGGMGGMGGGMGGMGMGGMGGGMFAVEDDLKLGTSKKAAPSNAQQPSASPVPTTAPAPEYRVRPATATGPKVSRIRLNKSAGQTDVDAWNRYFEVRASQVLPKSDGTPTREEITALADENARIRQTVRELMHDAANDYQHERQEQAKVKFNEVAVMIQSALRHGFAQPWMFEAMGLAMQAGRAPKPEIERALMSAIDFSRNDEDLIHAATYMAKLGFDERALQLFREYSVASPFRAEPYLHGLRLARQLNDVDGIRWACAGILSQAWPRENQHIEDEAKLIAKATHTQLLEEGRSDEAEQFATDIKQALVRDCIVVVTWTGEADLDLLVEEPTGTLCSVQNLRTSGGGVLLGDTFATSEGNSVDGYSEAYVCPHAFTGDYRMLVRRVWGNVTAGKVTVDVVKHYGTEKQEHMRQQIDLAENGALVLFDVKEGRREEPIAEKQIAHLQNAEQAIGRTVLAQQLNSSVDPTALRNFVAARQAGFFRDPRLFGRGGVGYMPVITSLPEGTNFLGSAIVSADRRYVRYNGSPFFSGIGDVATFNFVTGQQGGQQGGNPGQVGGGPGLGGGLGGGF